MIEMIEKNFEKYYNMKIEAKKIVKDTFSLQNYENFYNDLIDKFKGDLNDN